jgi:hypothetical protein
MLNTENKTKYWLLLVYQELRNSGLLLLIGRLDYKTTLYNTAGADRDVRDCSCWIVYLLVKPISLLELASQESTLFRA